MLALRGSRLIRSVATLASKPTAHRLRRTWRARVRCCISDLESRTAPPARRCRVI
jgi:hypothetical protein